MAYGTARIINHSIWAVCHFCRNGCCYFIYTIIGWYYLRFNVCGVPHFGGQFVEGSDKLLRPFGYYGSILGGFVAVAFVCIKANISVVLLLGALAAAAHGYRLWAESGVWYRAAVTVQFVKQIKVVLYTETKSQSADSFRTWF